MRAFFKKEQFLMTFLTSAMLGLVGAVLFAGFVLDVFFQSIYRQAAIVLSIWLLSGGVFYWLISILSRRWAGLRATLTLEIDFSLFLRKVFLALFFLFPMGMIFYGQFSQNFDFFMRYLDGGSIGNFLHGKDIFMIALGALVLLLGILISFIYLKKLKWQKTPDVLYVSAIVLVAVILRLALASLIKTLPVSDFALINDDALRIAKGIYPQNMYISTHVVIIMIYGYLYKIFGANLAVLYVFHTICYASAGVFFYYAGKEMFESRFWAVLLGLLLVAWPSLLFYSNVLTPEHVFILIECACLYMLVHFFKKLDKFEETVNWKQGLLWYLLFGLLFGLLSLFRPFSQLYLVAFIITLLIFYLTRRTFIKRGIGIIALLIAFLFVGNLPSTIAEHYHNQFARTRPCNLLVGMNFDTVGTFNKADSITCIKLQQHIPDDAQYTKAVLDIVLQRISKNRDQIPVFFLNKMTFLWGQSAQIMQYATSNMTNLEGLLLEPGILAVMLIDLMMMFLSTIISLAGVIIAFFRDVKPYIFFSLLVLFGFNLMEIIFEVQTRYRTVIMPLLILFVVWSLMQISTIFTRRAEEKTPLT